MTHDGMSSIALVFNPASDPTHDTRINAGLKEFCSYWLLLTDEDNDPAVSDIRNAMQGIDGTVLNLSDIPAGNRANELSQLVAGKASHLMLLQPGVVVECEQGFALNADDRQPEQLLQLSPSRDIGCWQTAIIPNSVDHWELDKSSHFCIKQQSEISRNNRIRVLDHNRFARKRSPDEKAINRLLEKYRDKPCSQTAMSIAEAFYKHKDYQQAVDWFQAVPGSEAASDVQWSAHYLAAQCLLQLDAEPGQIEFHLAAAFDLDADRMEPLYYLVKLYRQAGDYSRACELAKIAEQIKEPAAGTVFEPEIYRYLLTQEYAESCWQLKDDSKCIEVVNHALRKSFQGERQRRQLAGLRALAYERSCPPDPAQLEQKNRLLMIIAFRNAGEFLIKCINSIQQQSYTDYRVILVDDASTDGALSAAGKLDERFTVIVNEQRRGALHNQISAIREYASDDDIVVHLDGDDWLAHDDALAKINEIFNRTRCWLMYGQFENSLGGYGSCEPLVANGEPLMDQLNRMYFPMHIRAYRAGILTELIRQDADLDVLRDEQGNFLDAVSDMALMRALIQVAGAEHTRYNEEILYIYNRSNPESHYQTREAMDLQKRQSAAASAKPALAQAKHYTNSSSAFITNKKVKNYEG